MPALTRAVYPLARVCARPSTDSDDDLPVAQLLKQRKAKSGAKSPKSTSSRSTAKKRKAPAKKKKSSSAASVASSTKRARTKSAAPRVSAAPQRERGVQFVAVCADTMNRWCRLWPCSVGAYAVARQAT